MNENVLNKVSSMLSELEYLYAIDSIYFTVGKFLPPEELTLNYFEHCKALRVKRLRVASVVFNGFHMKSMWKIKRPILIVNI